MGRYGAPDWSPYSPDYPDVADIDYDALADAIAAAIAGLTLTAIVYPHGVWEIEGLTQVLETERTNNTPVVLYTVPADETLFVVSFSLSIENFYTSARYAYLQLRNDTGGTETLWAIAAPAAGMDAYTIPFSVPLQVAEGWDFRIFSANADTWIRAGLAGYTLPAS